MKILLSCEGNNKIALPHVERENVDSQKNKMVELVIDKQEELMMQIKINGTVAVAK